MVLDFPDISGRSETWQLVYNTQTFSSPLNGIVQTKEMPGARWRATVNFVNLSTDKAAKLRSFLAQMRGQSGRCWLSPSAERLSSGVGDPRVNGGGQTGNAINVDGFELNTLVVAEGDYVEIDGELKIATADTLSSVLGEGVVSFEPPLVRAPTDNNSIRVISPRCRMRLMNDSQASFQLSLPQIHNVTLQFEEDLF